ncbi:MAG: hypothetical protein WC473_03925 [Patescibacteria group bacterium]
MSKNWKNLALATGMAWFIIIVMIVGASCSRDPEQADNQPSPIIDPIKEAITVGNHSWIPFNWDYEYTTQGISVSEASRILNVIDNFESARPWLEMTAWKLEVTYKSYFHCQCIYGVWVDHRLRPGYVEEYQAGGYPTGRYIKQEE